MTVEQTIGQKIRTRREVLGLTQEELGVRLGTYLTRPWPRQAVSVAEKGGRDFRAAELVALAQVLGTTPNYLTYWDTAPGDDTLILLEELFRLVDEAWQRLGATRDLLARYGSSRISDWLAESGVAVSEDLGAEE